MSKIDVNVDAETYVRATRDKGTARGKNIEKIQQYRKSEIDETLQEVDALKARKLLDDVKRGILTPQNTVISQVFQGKNADEINQILDNMTPEALQNLMTLASRLDTPQQVNVGIAPSQGQQREDVILTMLLKHVLEENKNQPPQNTAKEMVEAITAGIRLANESRASQTPPPAPQAGVNPVELIKLGAEMQRPAIDAVNKKDKEIFDLRMKELESKMPQDPIETIKYVKEVAGTLGLNSGQKTAIDLQLEEMKQNREIDMKRLDWEQKKYELESDAEVGKWEQFNKILSGPIGRAIQSMGDAGADRVRGRRPANVVSAPRTVQTQCPQCQKVIYVDADADTAVCGFCGASLQKAPNMPEPTRVADAVNPAAAASQTVATVAEEEGEEESEPDEAEEGTDEAGK